MLRIAMMGLASTIGIGAVMTPELPALAQFGIAGAMVAILLALLLREQQDRKALHAKLAQEAREREARMDKLHEEHRQMLATMIERNHATLEATTAALRDNAEATRRQSVAYHDASVAIAGLRSKIE